MERRLVLGILLLALGLSLAIGTGLAMEAIHAPAEAALRDAAERSLAGDMETAVPLARKAYSRWEKYRNVTAVFADHTPMDDTQKLFQEMLVYARTEETPHFAAACMELSTMLKAMYETHAFSLKNIL